MDDPVVVRHCFLGAQEVSDSRPPSLSPLDLARFGGSPLETPKWAGTHEEEATQMEATAFSCAWVGSPGAPGPSVLVLCTCVPG